MYSTALNCMELACLSTVKMIYSPYLAISTLQCLSASHQGIFSSQIKKSVTNLPFSSLFMLDILPKH